MIATSTFNETLAVPLDGLAEAEVRIRFGGGELTVREAQPGMLISGSVEGGAIVGSSGRPGKIELEPLTPGRAFGAWRPLHWDLGITTEIPVDLRLETGGNRSTINLTALRIRGLELDTGASETTVRLPTTGQTSVHIACGLASVVVEVPSGVAGRIRGHVAFGSIKVDESRFTRWTDGWISPDYEAAPNRVDIAVEGGLGSVQIG